MVTIVLLMFNDSCMKPVKYLLSSDGFFLRFSSKVVSEQ